MTEGKLIEVQMSAEGSTCSAVHKWTGCLISQKRALAELTVDPQLAAVVLRCGSLPKLIWLLRRITQGKLVEIADLAETLWRRSCHPTRITDLPEPDETETTFHRKCTD